MHTKLLKEFRVGVWILIIGVVTAIAGLLIYLEPLISLLATGEVRYMTNLLVIEFPSGDKVDFGPALVFFVGSALTYAGRRQVIQKDRAMTRELGHLQSQRNSAATGDDDAEYQTALQHYRFRRRTARVLSWLTLLANMSVALACFGIAYFFSGSSEDGAVAIFWFCIVVGVLMLVRSYIDRPRAAKT